MADVQDTNQQGRYAGAQVGFGPSPGFGGAVQYGQGGSSMQQQQGMNLADFVGNLDHQLSTARVTIAQTWSNPTAIEIARQNIENCRRSLEGLGTAGLIEAQGGVTAGQPQPQQGSYRTQPR
jgi:hypothetical protein